MSACEKCMHLEECYEQRGRCTSFKTLKQWRKERRQEIEQLNDANKKTTPKGTEDGDKDGP